jgi:PST family polysaccharide transporter
MTLTNSVLQATRWSAVSQVSRQLVQLAVTIVLAHLLSPDEFGVIALATVVSGFVILLSDLGTSAAVIQRSESTTGFLSAVFWLNIAFGLIVMLWLWPRHPSSRRLCEQRLIRC